MVSSVLNPEKIVGRQNTNIAAAQNFVSGGSLLGSSVLNSAANKIVGFQRAGVQPAAPAVDSIISTISTNINNNVTTTINKTLQGFSADYQRRVKEFNINKITTNVTNTVNKTLQGFSADYQRRLKQVDDAKPIGILGKFLTVYKTSLGFIQFFGNKKNIDKVRDNLEALKKSFTESFEVAKLIRQVIIKIVKQLSNLPVASPSGGGGLNLDVDIPGGGLKKSAPKGLGRMMKGKGKMLALGAGALGLGALGAGAVNALSDSPQAQAAGTSPEIPGDTVDRFSSIVDKFANAISNLFKSGKPKQQQPPGSAKGTTKPPAPPKPPGAPPGPTQLIQGNAPAEIKSLMETIAGPESGGNYEAMNPGTTLPGATKMTIAEVARKATGAVGKYQNMPEYLVQRAKDAGLDPNKDLYSPENQDKITRWHISNVLGGKESDVVKRLQKDPNAIQNTLKTSTWTGLQNLTQQQFLQNYQKNLKTYQGVPSAPVLPSSAQVAAAPTATQTRQQIAQQVAQPPAMQQPVVMPINLGGGGQQQTSGGGVSGPPPSQGSGPSVPFLPAANTDNFLVLYSRMVYNIVDG